MNKVKRNRKDSPVASMTARVRIVGKHGALERAMKKSEQFLSLFQLYANQREVALESLAWECGGQEVSGAMTPEMLVTEGGWLLLSALDVTDVQMLKAKRILRSLAGETEDDWAMFFDQQFGVAEISKEDVLGCLA